MSSQHKRHVRFPEREMEKAAEKGMFVTAHAMREINETEHDALVMIAELSALAERLSFLITAARTDRDAADLDKAVDHTVHDLMRIAELRVRRQAAYGILLLSLGAQGTKELLERCPPFSEDK
jgi:hypothetical protein